VTGWFWLVLFFFPFDCTDAFGSVLASRLIVRLENHSRSHSLVCQLRSEEIEGREAQPGPVLIRVRSPGKLRSTPFFLSTPHCSRFRLFFYMLVLVVPNRYEIFFSSMRRSSAEDPPVSDPRRSEVTVFFLFCFSGMRVSMIRGA